MKTNGRMDYKIIWTGRSLINVAEILQFISEDNAFAAKKWRIRLEQKGPGADAIPELGFYFCQAQPQRCA